jgi:hypothetical protein
MSIEQDIMIGKKELYAEEVAAENYKEDLQTAQDPLLRKLLKRNMKDELEDHAKHLQNWLLLQKLKAEKAKEKKRYS